MSRKADRKKKKKDREEIKFQKKKIEEVWVNYITIIKTKREANAHPLSI